MSGYHAPTMPVSAMLSSRTFLYTLSGASGASMNIIHYKFYFVPPAIELLQLCILVSQFGGTQKLIRSTMGSNTRSLDGVPAWVICHHGISCWKKRNEG